MTDFSITIQRGEPHGTLVIAEKMIDDEPYCVADYYDPLTRDVDIKKSFMPLAQAAFEKAERFYNATGRHWQGTPQDRADFDKKVMDS
ncbi:MAG: hypothetical protein ACPGQQ_02955 [Candidatus Puniceispirillaceae bacterium]